MTDTRSTPNAPEDPDVPKTPKTPVTPGAPVVPGATTAGPATVAVSLGEGAAAILDFAEDGSDRLDITNDLAMLLESACALGGLPAAHAGAQTRTAHLADLTLDLGEGGRVDYRDAGGDTSSLTLDEVGMLVSVALEQAIALALARDGAAGDLPGPG